MNKARPTSSDQPTSAWRSMWTLVFLRHAFRDPKASWTRHTMNVLFSTTTTVVVCTFVVSGLLFHMLSGTFKPSHTTNATTQDIVLLPARPYPNVLVAHRMYRSLGKHPETSLQQQSWLTGTDVFVGAPNDILGHTQKVLRNAGARIVLETCTECFLLRWQHGQGWLLFARSSSGTLDTYLGTREQLKTEAKISAVFADAELPDGVSAQPILLTMAPEDSAKAMTTLARDMSQLLGHAILLGVFLCSMMLGAMVGIRLDRARTVGHTEPWVMAIHPPWVLYGAEIVRAMFWAGVVFASLVASAWIWNIPLHWPLAAAQIWCLPWVVAVGGMWSVFSTMLFHHEQGRFFARLVLSPFTWVLAMMVRVAGIWAAMQMLRPKDFKIFVAQCLDSGLWWVGASGLCAVLVMGLAVLAHARVGARREGLRKT